MSAAADAIVGELWCVSVIRCAVVRGAAVVDEAKLMPKCLYFNSAANAESYIGRILNLYMKEMLESDLQTVNALTIAEMEAAIALFEDENPYAERLRYSVSVVTLSHVRTRPEPWLHLQQEAARYHNAAASEDSSESEDDDEVHNSDSDDEPQPRARAQVEADPNDDVEVDIGSY